MKRLLKISLLATVLPSVALAQSQLDGRQLFREVGPGVVTVSGEDSTGRLMQGSGVVIAPGIVVSNCHVVGGSSAGSVEHMGQRYRAELIASRADRDLCLMRVAGMEARPVTIGSSSHIEIGEQVFAVGAPRGLSNSMSQGIVSGLRRIDGAKLIQTTAAISSGSSGGGLFNANGELLGVTTLYLEDSQQLNFAVPVEWVSELLNNRDHKPSRTAAGEDSADEAARAAGEAQAAADAAQAATETAVASGNVRSDQTPWVEVAASKSLAVDFKRGSFEIGENKGGKTLAVALARIRDLSNDNLEFRKHYVTTIDCDRGHGKLVSLDLEGNYVADIDYVSQGNTLASGIGDMLCALYVSTYSKTD